MTQPEQKNSLSSLLPVASANAKVQVSQMLAVVEPDLLRVAIESSARRLAARREKSLPITRKHWVLSFCPIVAKIIADRLEVTDGASRLTRAESCLVALNAVTQFDPHWSMPEEERIKVAAQFVVAAATVRAFCPVSRGGLDPNYWPYGMAGGHFNADALEADELQVATA